MSGFQSPNYTQCPNDLFDVLMSDMDETELKVVLAVVRGTFGWHRDELTLSLTKMAQITGLSENGVIAGATAAEKRGLIERVTDGRKSTVWRAYVSTSTSEVVLPQPVRQPTSTSEGQLGLKKVKEKKHREGAQPAPSRARPEERALLDLFVELTHLPPTGKSPKERSADAVRYYQPIRRMIELANGRGETCLRDAIARMRKDGLTISAPQSVEAVFRAVYSETDTPSPSMPALKTDEDVRREMARVREAMSHR